MPNSRRNGLRQPEKRRLAQFELDHPLPISLLDALKKRVVDHTAACFLLLFLCVIVALGLSAAFWYFFEEQVIGKVNAFPIKRIICDKRIVGYYNLNSPIDLRDEQLAMLTHVILYPVDIHLNGNVLFKSSQDKKKFQKLLKIVKNNNVKLMFSTSERADGPKDFPFIVPDPKRRAVFVASIVNFIQTYHFDGVDVYWRWPENAIEKSSLVALCGELREKLTQLSNSTNRLEPYIISVVYNDMIDKINHPQIMKHVDFLSSEDNHYQGEWEPSDRVRPSSSLYYGNGLYSGGTVDTSMKYFACLTKEPKKLNILVNFEGRYWNNVIDETEKMGMLSFSADLVNGKIDGRLIPWRNLTKNGWNVTRAQWEPETRTPYIWNQTNRSFLAFENERSLEEKVEYSMEKNIGGFTIWNLNQDDDSNTLLNVISSAKMCSSVNDNSVNFDCDRAWKRK